MQKWKICCSQLFCVFISVENFYYSAIVLETIANFQENNRNPLSWKASLPLCCPLMQAPM